MHPGVMSAAHMPLSSGAKELSDCWYVCDLLVAQGQMRFGLLKQVYMTPT